MPALAIDVGGTKVAIAVVTDDGVVVCKLQQFTDLSGPDSVLQQILTMSDGLLAGQQPDAIGICVPAVLEPGTDRVVWAPNLPGWENTDIKAKLEQHFGVPTVIEYDGHAAVLGEWWVGEGRGYQAVACVIIGTGIGGGFIIENRLWQGRNRLAGAVGWFPLHSPNGLVHWEEVACGPAIARHARELIAAGAPSAMAADDITAKLVFDTAAQGDAVACQAIERAAEYIGLGLSIVISIANPDIVILGGSVGQHAGLLLPTIQRLTNQWSQPYAARDLPILCSKLGEEAGLLGAAYSAFQKVAR